MVIFAIIIVVIPLWLGYQLQYKLATDRLTSEIRQFWSTALYFIGFTSASFEVMIFVIAPLTNTTFDTNSAVASLISALCIAPTILTLYKVELWRAGTVKLAHLSVLLGFGGGAFIIELLF